VRAVTQPYPGAFAPVGERKLIVWASRVVPDVPGAHGRAPGTVLSTAPLRIACGEDALEILAGQQGDAGLYLAGPQLAQEFGLVEGSRLHAASAGPQRKTRVLILGVNGFIGNHLSERLLRDGCYEIYGMDIGSDAIERLKSNPDFHFVEGDISIHTEWIEYHIKKCDVVLPLVAIATPIEYTRNPLRVFELDFEENLKLVRHCVKYRKRVIFPSTSEVYGMCTDERFDEDQSNLVVGPINKQRWIYSVSKQLLDRVIWAYGQQGLRFTLFRPFNWMGPRLDRLNSARIGSSRAITQLILNLVEGTPIRLVDGGAQKRCFTDVADGIEALARIVENAGGRCDGQIINIGNPDNEASIAELAHELLRQFEQHPLRGHFPPFAGFRAVESRSFYGAGYQDVSHRKPSIDNAHRLLGWNPTVPMHVTIEKRWTSSCAKRWPSPACSPRKKSATSHPHRRRGAPDAGRPAHRRGHLPRHARGRAAPARPARGRTGQGDVFLLRGAGQHGAALVAPRQAALFVEDAALQSREPVRLGHSARRHGLARPPDRAPTWPP